MERGLSRRSLSHCSLFHRSLFLHLLGRSIATTGPALGGGEHQRFGAVAVGRGEAAADAAERCSMPLLIKGLRQCSNQSSASGLRCSGVSSATTTLVPRSILDWPAH